jgi:hypothetical protein
MKNAYLIHVIGLKIKMHCRYIFSKCKIVLKLDFTYVSATLPAFAAVLKWHIDPAVAVLSYFASSWCISMSGRYSMVKDAHGVA